MRSVLTLVCAVTAVLSWQGTSTASPSAGAASYDLRASMTSRQVVTPTNKPWQVPAAVADAHGFFVGKLTVTSGTRKLAWRITYADIGRAPLVIADVHLGKPGRFGQVLVRLCTSCQSGQKGTTKVSAAAAKAMSTGNAWVTVITSTYPNGVVRGQIRVR